MASGVKLTAADITARKDAGRYIKTLRLEAELTQNALANLLDYTYYTFISGIEVGDSRLPYSDFVAVAKILVVDPQEFSKTLVGYYEPALYKALYNETPRPKRARNRPAKK